MPPFNEIVAIAAASDKDTRGLPAWSASQATTGLPELDYVSEMGVSLEALVLHHGETGTRSTTASRKLFFAGRSPHELARAVNLGMNEVVPLFACRLVQASVKLSEKHLRDVSLSVVMSILWTARRANSGWRSTRPISIRAPSVRSSSSTASASSKRTTSRRQPPSWG